MSSQSEELAQEANAKDRVKPAEYLIWPRKGLGPEQVDDTDAAIRRIVGSETTVEQVIGGVNSTLRFWFVSLKIEQIGEVEKLDGVSCLVYELRHRLSPVETL